MAAEAAISSVVQLLGDLLLQKVKFVRGVEGQVQMLKEELNRMQSFMRDANKKQGQDERVRNWISDIREVALDAEDTIEMFILKVENVRKSRSLLEGCACYPSHLRRLDRIGEEIETIRARLDAIDKSRERYGIKDLGHSGGMPDRRPDVEARRRLAPWHKNEHLVGVEDDVKKLLEAINDEEKKGLSVAAVVGMGGIGKSTLAREIYNHPNIVSGRFDCRAWVVISSEFNLQETIKQLIMELTSSEQEKQQLRGEIKQLEESTRDMLYLQRKLEELLHKRLEGKTYFIVLDDVWEKEHLDSLITAFPKEQDKTSRLLLTTRNEVIANQCQSLHKMKFLDPEESWELFLKKALIGNSYGEFPKELEKIGRQIVDKCEGLPLSITVTGGLLAETRSNRVWEEALKELNSHLQRAKNSVLAILELSYQNLSPKLKSCFLCLAFFKEDAVIPVKRLVNIIVGHGLIQQVRRTTEEEMARGYLDELVNRNMVQVKDLTLDNRVKSCHLHDSLRDICLTKATEEIGLEILKGDSGISMHKPRHRVMQFNGVGTFSMNENKHIRSLFMLKVNVREIKSSNWKGFQHLKILDFEGYYHLRKFPPSFRLLLGLKQLRIGGESMIIISTTFTRSSVKSLKLPTWLNTLKKLEVLDLRTRFVEFPNVALEMDSLRYIHAKFVRGAITGHWKNIDTLKYIKDVDWMRSSLRLMDCCPIRELGIQLDDEFSSSTVRESLEKLENLVKLSLRWKLFLRIDPTLTIPHLTNLTKLKLRGWMSKCPSARMLPPNLSHLTLENSDLDKDPMQELSELPKLSYLKLKELSFVGENMLVSRDGFPRLLGLSLQGLRHLRSVDIEEGGMPLLKLLQVNRCPALDTKNLWNKSYHLQILTHTM